MSLPRSTLLLGWACLAHASTAIKYVPSSASFHVQAVLANGTSGFITNNNEVGADGAIGNNIYTLTPTLDTAAIFTYDVTTKHWLFEAGRGLGPAFTVPSLYSTTRLAPNPPRPSGIPLIKQARMPSTRLTRTSSRCAGLWAHSTLMASQC